MKGNYWLWLLTIIYALLLFFLSIKSSLPIKNSFSYQDKFFHFLAYFILGILVFKACNRSFSSLSLFQIGLITVFVCTFYGIFNEIAQTFVPNRQPSFFDALANSLGGLLASIWSGKWLLK
ncbi:MAG: VanZ family protein [Candidatus Desulfofervidus auxilii]|nr:VanZ family protein [Candidatus Desulfofervidus auxilii]